jgi:hypothetical protein
VRGVGGHAGAVGIARAAAEEKKKGELAFVFFLVRDLTETSRDVC